MALPENIFSMFTASRGPTAKAMQTLLGRIGAATAGTRDVLQARVFKEIGKSKILGPKSDTDPARILSIDMGIKNLAYCVTDVRLSTPKPGAARMNILSWRRLDLTEQGVTADATKNRELGTATGIESAEGGPFTPEKLSATAYQLLQHNLLKYNPDVILIERQRWRSASSAAIQQWTVRVNTLEAMLWAVLETLRHDRAKWRGRETKEAIDFPQPWVTFGVDPKRVAHFWLDEAVQDSPHRMASGQAAEDETEDIDATESDTINSKKLSRGKVEKKAKIQLLRSWLDSNNASTSTPTAKGSADRTEAMLRPTLSFTFSDADQDKTVGYDLTAEATRQSLLYATDKPSKRSKGMSVKKADVKKVDDVTDCFLQAAAWVAWEENRRAAWEQREVFRKEAEKRLGRALGSVASLEEATMELREEGKVKKKTDRKDKKTSKATR